MNATRQLIGKSDSIKQIKSFIQKAASSDWNVLIQGETGVGKEVVARLIHEKSKRNQHKFIKLNCANLNENLLESEIFGHIKGAFTGATFTKPGLIEDADWGTFFLDEIVDIPPSIQAKLLAVIEDQEFRSLGENKVKKVNIRFIFATNGSLEKLIFKDKFRADLYYRISVLNMKIPPLRSRKEDIPNLVFSILKKYKIQDKVLTQTALEKLMNHSYPGNIRELENIIKRASVFSNDKQISAEHIQFTNKNREKEYIKTPRYKFDEIIKALVECQGNKSKTAKKLGISRVHFYRILDELKK